MWQRVGILRRIATHVRSESDFSSSSVGILGAPFSKGQPRHGVDRGPDALRKYGLVKELCDLGIEVSDHGDIVFDEAVDTDHGKLRYPLTVGSACKKISDAVREVLRQNGKCVTLGGDHSLGIGTVHGHSRVHEDLCVLWIDAHADINTVATTPSGNFHGMSCSFIIKELQKYAKGCAGFDWIKPCVNRSNIAYIGLRDIDPLEKLILTKENILHFSMRDIDRLGIFEVTNRAIEAINPSGKLSMHVSFDIDSIDKLITPSTGTSVHGGLTVREALCLAEEISKLDVVHALDIVEVNPSLGNREQIENTLSIAILIIKTFLGYSRGGCSPKDLRSIPVV